MTIVENCRSQVCPSEASLRSLAHQHIDHTQPPWTCWYLYLQSPRNGRPSSPAASHHNRLARLEVLSPGGGNPRAKPPTSDHHCPKSEVYYLNERTTPFCEGPEMIASMSDTRSKQPVGDISCTTKYHCSSDVNAEPDRIYCGEHVTLYSSSHRCSSVLVIPWHRRAKPPRLILISNGPDAG